MNLLNLSSDAINKSMIEGLKAELRNELKEELMKPVHEMFKNAEERVDEVINNLCERVNLHGDNYLSSPFAEAFKNRTFRLEWLITKNIEHTIKA